QITDLRMPQKKVPKFDNSNLYQPNEKELQCENILIDLIQTLEVILNSFISTNLNIGSKFYKENIFPIIVDKFSNIMKIASPKIIIEILKCMEEIFHSNKDLFIGNLEEFWKFYESLANYIQSEFFINFYPKLSNDTQLTEAIINHLNFIYLDKDHEKINQDILLKDSFDHLLYFLNCLINSCYNNEENVAIDTPYKLLLDEQKIFDFILEILPHLYNKPESLQKYFEFLLKYIDIDLNDLHSEALCRKALEISIKFFTNQRINEDILLKNVVPYLLQTKKVILLRNKNDYINGLLHNLKKTKIEMQLWHLTSECQIEVLKYIITSNTITWKKNINHIWQNLITSYEQIFHQSEAGYLNKCADSLSQEELIKSCQELEISIINFIVNSLLPFSMHISKEYQLKLLNLMDMGSNFNYTSSNSSSAANNITSSISKVCISNLFDLCKYRTEESLANEIQDSNSEDYIRIKIKIAKLCTPILIKRCKDTLKKFLDDEVKSGAMPLGRSRLEDVKFVLEKIKTLEVYPDYDNVEEGSERKNVDLMYFIMKKKKSHLICLLPLLSEFITTKENEIKIIVKDIFRIISEEIGIK
ncbi:MAG: hypothetical protein MJ252_14490, partial [archaeon]|nr:hypothetical protein [archaeon]